ncbi:exodeoxyribonuclease VII small subunit [Paludisphaera soli]|uniref:exodeoxyribonuclease VII small subunit n=1 Tax=Paludisphaera soli TaxID=2712865 RepID=UPI0013EE1052|nr:exodeoxyribonuclease VII small subunit [Paludisphaera soli]
MPDEPEVRFESALADLEAIVESLQRGEPALDAALEKYQKGVALLNRCYGLLERAERSVSVLTGFDEAGEPITTGFDPTATFDLAKSAAATIVASVALDVEPDEVPAPKPARRKRVPKAAAPAPEPAADPEPIKPEVAPEPEPEYDRFDPPF